MQHGRVNNNVPHQGHAEHHGSVESLPRKEKRYGAANLEDSEEVTKPLPEANLSEEIDHFGDSEKLRSSCEKKQAAGQNLQNPDDDGQTLA